MRKATVLLPFLYLLPWGIQCLVNNFMPVYLASLPFATEKTVGYVMAFGSVVTMVTQPVWAKAADRSSNKSRVLMWSFICLAFFSILFINQKITQPLLYGMVFLFYSCYMVHQPLIDSIAVENENRLHCSFGAIRSFASLGYALAGLVFGIIDQGTSNGIFYYVAALALASAVLAGRMPPPETAIQKQRAAKAGVINKQFVLFLGYTFFLYIASSAMSTFFPVYYAKELSGDVGVLSIVISAATLLEWAVMVVFGGKIARLPSRTAFLIIALSGVCKGLIMYAVQQPLLILLSFVFHGIWYGVLWASATPYLNQIIPRKNLTVAQSIWTLLSSGIAAAAGSFAGGQLGELFGLRNLFLIIALLMGMLSVMTPVLFPKKIS